tara:strand:+ start:2983 stop:3162 length:180 start_codon:yes stop_codon:yes gene_type:complete
MAANYFSSCKRLKLNKIILINESICKSKLSTIDAKIKRKMFIKKAIAASIFNILINFSI